MKFNKEEINKKCEEYHKNTGNTATHIFVRSYKQEEIGRTFEEKRTTVVFGDIYSEMRSRDSDLVFNFEDTKFVNVGRVADVKFGN